MGVRVLHANELSYFCHQTKTVMEAQEREKQLVHEVPASLQLCFMTHSQHLPKMAGEIAQGSYSREELEALTEVVAKCELLHCMELNGNIRSRCGPRYTMRCSTSRSRASRSI